MAQSYFHILATRGDRWSFRLPVPPEAESGTIEFAVVENPGDPPVIRRLTTDGGVTVADGYATAAVTAAASLAVPAAVYPYSLRLADAGEETTLHRGRLIVRERAGRLTGAGGAVAEGALQFDAGENSGLLQLLT